MGNNSQISHVTPPLLNPLPLAGRAQRGGRSQASESLREFHVNRYSDIERAAIYRVIAERRDMRHFRSDAISAEILQRVLHAAHLFENSRGCTDAGA